MPVVSAAWLISKPYCAAMLGAVLEYLVEFSAFPAIKIQVSLQPAACKRAAK
jgi:hypothetical protein